MRRNKITTNVNRQMQRWTMPDVREAGIAMTQQPTPIIAFTRASDGRLRLEVRAA
jgi:hypothetical protein